MAVLRKFNWQPQQRVDVAHLKMIESAVAGDFDMLATLFSASPEVISGFALSYTIGQPASSILVDTSRGLLSATASAESGSLYRIESGGTEQLSTNLIGSFSPSSFNYVGIRIVSQVDDTTADLMSFITPEEVRYTQTVAFAEIHKHIFTTSTSGFESQDVELAIVETDAANNIVSVTDERSMLFRSENTRFVGPVSGFTGGEANLDSLRKWIDVITTRLWVEGGEYWYSTNSDARQTKVSQPSGSVLGWNGTNLTWSGVTITFANSTGWYNTVTDSIGGTPIADGQCLYVDLDRTANTIGLVAAVAPLTSLGVSAPNPGNRMVLAWRQGANVYFRDRLPPVGSPAQIATIADYGEVKINAPAGVGDTVAAIVDKQGVATANAVLGPGLSRGNTGAQGVGGGILKIGHGANDTDIEIGGTTKASGYINTFKSSAGTVAGVKYDGSATASIDLMTLNVTKNMLSRQAASNWTRVSSPLTTNNSGDSLACGFFVTQQDNDDVDVWVGGIDGATAKGSVYKQSDYSYPSSSVGSFVFASNIGVYAIAKDGVNVVATGIPSVAGDIGSICSSVNSGVAWSELAAPIGGIKSEIFSVDCLSGMFVAGGYRQAAPTTGVLGRSATGATWFDISGSISGAVRKVVANQANFWVATQNGANVNISVSLDNTAVGWSLAATIIGHSFLDIIWDGSRLVALVSSGATHRIFTSDDNFSTAVYTTSASWDDLHSTRNGYMLYSTGRRAIVWSSNLSAWSEEFIVAAAGTTVTLVNNFPNPTFVNKLKVGVAVGATAAGALIMHSFKEPT